MLLTLAAHLKEEVLQCSFEIQPTKSSRLHLQVWQLCWQAVAVQLDLTHHAEQQLPQQSHLQSPATMSHRLAIAVVDVRPRVAHNTVALNTAQLTLDQRQSYRARQANPMERFSLLRLKTVPTTLDSRQSHLALHLRQDSHQAVELPSVLLQVADPLYVETCCRSLSA